MSKSKIEERAFYQPGASSIEGWPTTLQFFYAHPPIMLMPHWHAQVEINFVFRGSLDYQMHGHRVSLQAGDLALFWGGLPHQVTDTSVDPLFIAIHLPLVHFFRLRLDTDTMRKLTHGATLVTRTPDGTDFGNFNRWSDFMRAPEAHKRDHAIDELLLRLERISFEPFDLVEPSGLVVPESEAGETTSYATISNILTYIAENFRYDIDSADIAVSADIHPKYAMSVFKRSTGMTLSEYIALMRVSYAQAILMQDDVNILEVAMDSGFGSLSGFNAAFRRVAGMSPTDFRRELRVRSTLPH